MNPKITVTQPALPPIEEFIPYLKEIWSSKILTNNGPFHQKLEQALSEYLGVPYLSLFCNATIALITALQALELKGEVITTPYSFVATANSIVWNGLSPIFCDIEDETCNIDVGKIEQLIGPATSAIMPVHVYGMSCDMDAIDAIASKHDLKVLYDAAHAFGIRKAGESVLVRGDMSVLSFHATKNYTTIEGGGIICRDADMKKKIDNLKNFGFTSETSVIAAGINGKMNELQAAFGLMYLQHVDSYVAKRKAIDAQYRSLLRAVPGITLMSQQVDVSHNFSYFPIRINAAIFGRTRDEVYDALKKRNILTRRYFYPLISQFPPYAGLPSAQPGCLPVAERVASEVLCLPIYPELASEDVARIVTYIEWEAR